MTHHLFVFPYPPTHTQPIGLNCLLVPAPHGGANGGNTKDAAAAAGEALVAYVLKGRRGRGLRGVGQEIGFCDADVAPFRELAQVHVISPSLAAQAAGDVRTQSPEERRGRGGLQPHLTGVVLEDGRQPGGMLQLLSQGAPTVVLPWCSEFFDGATLSRLTPDARALILETFCRRWALDDFNVTALSYTPVPPALRSQLRMAGGLTAGAVGRAPVPIYVRHNGELTCRKERTVIYLRSTPPFTRHNIAGGRPVAAEAEARAPGCHPGAVHAGERGPAGRAAAGGRG